MASGGASLTRVLNASADGGLVDPRTGEISLPCNICGKALPHVASRIIIWSACITTNTHKVFVHFYGVRRVVERHFSI